MAEQQRKQRPAPKERVEEEATVAAPTERGEKLNMYKRAASRTRSCFVQARASYPRENFAR
jgi:hypothetical protein